MKNRRRKTLATISISQLQQRESASSGPSDPIREVTSDREENIKIRPGHQISLIMQSLILQLNTDLK
jgi:hypothetical protein